MNDLAPLVQDAQADFEQAKAPAELENAKARYLGKSGLITEQLKALASLAQASSSRRRDSCMVTPVGYCLAGVTKASFASGASLRAADTRKPSSSTGTGMTSKPPTENTRRAVA